MAEEEFENFLLDDAYYKTQLTEQYKNRKKWETPDIRKLKATIPGTVLEIFVKKGQKVAKGDVMLSYQAMKMHNKLQAPVAGKVKDIYVAEGQSFPKNTLLVELA